MRYTILGTFLTIAVCTISCSRKPTGHIINSSNDGIIKLNLNDAISSTICDESEFINDVKIIPLETNDESLIHEPIFDIYYTNERIYIWDGINYGGLICFDKNGKFINRAKMGQGPEEILHICNISYDKINNQVIVVDNPRITILDKNLNFVNSYYLQNGTFGAISTTDGYMLLRGAGYKRDLNDNDNYAIEITDKNFNTIGFMLRNQTNYLAMSTVINNSDGSYTLSIPGSDTIYNYSNGELKALYVLDYKDKAVVNKENINNKREIQGIFHMCEYMETKNHNIMKLHDSEHTYLTFTDKRTGVVKGGKNIGWKNNEIIGIYTAMNTYQDTIITLDWPMSYPKGSLESSEYISEHDINTLESMQDDDNPFLILYTLKEFSNE